MTNFENVKKFMKITISVATMAGKGIHAGNITNLLVVVDMDIAINSSSNVYLRHLMLVLQQMVTMGTANITINSR